MYICVRGIYSTGLIQLLLKEKFDLTKLSDIQKERFGIETEKEEDVMIKDLKDKTGIVVFKKEGIDDTIVHTLRKYLWDSLYIKKSDNIWYIFLGLESKRVLDTYRSEVVPTIDYHHTFRLDSPNIVDYAEILLGKGVPKDILSQSMFEYQKRKLQYEGVIERFHRKLDGSFFSKIEVVKSVKDNFSLETIRVLKPFGNYDVVNEKIEPGDYAITTYRFGEWFYVIRYYNKNRELKGVYININTPLEISHRAIRYIDLAVDVVIWRDKMIVADLEELEQAHKNNYITKRLYDKTKEVLENAKNISLSNN